MERKKKCRGACQQIKYMTEFGKDRRRKNGRRNVCKVCTNIRRADNILTKEGRFPTISEFTDNEKTIFMLGVSVGEGRCRDLEKACNIQMRANIRLFEVIREQDKQH